MPGLGDLAAAVAVVLLAAGYLLLRRRANRPVSRWRAGAFLTGCGLLAVALLPPVAPYAHADFRGHMLQHLLIGMYSPVALVLGVTVPLRALPGLSAPATRPGAPRSGPAGR